MLAKVFRPETNKHGQIIGELDDYYLGDVAGIILGGPAPETVKDMPGLVTSEGLIGIPRGSDVQQHDRLEVGGQLYKVTGPRLWNHPHPLTGTLARFYWVQARTVHG